MSKIKTDATGKICTNATGKICICQEGYTVVFPNTDVYTYQRSYTLTDVGGGVWFANPSFSLTLISGSPILDFCTITNPSYGEIHYFDSSIEMTIDELTGERSIRMIGGAYTETYGASYGYDTTQVFASGNTFNVSAGSNRVVTLVKI